MKMIVSLGAIVLLNFAASAVQAAPTSTFTWTDPTQYEDGTMIDTQSDVLSFRLYCSATSGGPYVSQVFSTPSPSVEDMVFCVQGTPGTYYMAATAISALHGTESVLSNETTRTYTATDLGKVPLPPTLLQVQ